MVTGSFSFVPLGKRGIQGDFIDINIKFITKSNPPTSCVGHPLSGKGDVSPTNPEVRKDKTN